jgi:hypothetical protein
MAHVFDTFEVREYRQAGSWQSGCALLISCNAGEQDEDVQR